LVGIIFGRNWSAQEFEDLRETATMTAHSVAPVSYAFKASLIGAAHRFELTEAGLAWHIGGRSGVWPYADIAAIRLSYRPVSMQARRFRADLRHASGARLIILSTSWQTAALMAPQDKDYRAFIVGLHERMAAAGSRAELSGGLGRNAYAAGMALLVLVGTLMAGLLIRALVTGEIAGALFLVGFAALFGWQVGGFVRRNRPLAYGFAQVPEALLP
jgi:hypothetical protein